MMAEDNFGVCQLAHEGEYTYQTVPCRASDEVTQPVLAVPRFGLLTCYRALCKKLIQNADNNYRDRCVVDSKSLR